MLPLIEAAAAAFDQQSIQLALRVAGAARPCPNGLSIDERAAIYLYTMEVRPGYRELNVRLRGDLAAARPYFSFAKLLNSALAKLPIFEGGIWRALTNVDASAYSVEDRLSWSQFNSCTVASDTVQQFLGPGQSLLFMIDAGHCGVDIRQYSALDESDVLLPAGVEVEVLMILPDRHRTIMHVKQIHQVAHQVAHQPPPESAGLVIEGTCDRCDGVILQELGYTDFDVGMDFESVMQCTVVECGGSSKHDSSTRFRFGAGCKWSLDGRQADGVRCQDSGVVDANAAPTTPTLLAQERQWRALRLTAAPWNAEMCRGLSVEARCANQHCAAHTKPVLINLGFRTFDVGMNFDEVTCPQCNVECVDESASLWITHCRWNFVGRHTGGARQTGEGVAAAKPHQLQAITTDWRALCVTTSPP